MNLAEVYANETSAASKRTLNYIGDLANTVGVDISHWDIDKIFRTEGGELISSPTQLNKKFFFHAEILKKKTEFKALTEDQLKALKTFEQKIVDKRRAGVNDALNRTYKQLRDSARIIEQQQCDIKILNEELKSVSCNLIQEIEKTCSHSFFSLTEMAGDEIRFITRPIVLNWTRKDGKLFRVPFGKMLVVVQPDRPRMRVFPGEGRIAINDRHFHPFIDFESGEICWGSAQELASKHIGTGNWCAAFDLLASLLTTYPGGTPYRALEEFYLHAFNEKGEQPWKIEGKAAFVPQDEDEFLCDFCESNAHDPEEVQCGECDVVYCEQQEHVCD